MSLTIDGVRLTEADRLRYMARIERGYDEPEPHEMSWEELKRIAEECDSMFPNLLRPQAA